VISVKKNEFLEFAKHHGVEKSYEELCEDAKIKTLICKELDSVGKSSGLMSF
jgi:phosphoenolpyruvate carboxylase